MAIEQGKYRPDFCRNTIKDIVKELRRTIELRKIEYGSDIRAGRLDKGEANRRHFCLVDAIKVLERHEELVTKNEQKDLGLNARERYNRK